MSTKKPAKRKKKSTKKQSSKSMLCIVPETTYAAETYVVHEPKVNPLDVQVAGDHYKKMAIQPVEFSHKNNLNFLQGTIIKYVTRFKDKNGKIDLEKAKHCIDMLIGFEYPEA